MQVLETLQIKNKENKERRRRINTKTTTIAIITSKNLNSVRIVFLKVAEKSKKVIIQGGRTKS
jgi:hypothetical protein